jgi:hypothetical protein
MRAFSLIVLLVVAVGCAPRSRNHSANAGSGALDETRVLAIARAAVATNETWIDRAKFETPNRHPDGSWGVIVWRLPATPGGSRVILIDETGRVTDYLYGR